MEERKVLNREVLEEFVQRYRPRAIKKAYYLTRNQEDAHDLVQESFQRLSQYCQQADAPRQITSLFVVILKNAFIDTLRTRKRVYSLDWERGGELGYHDIVPHPEPDVLDRLIRQETAQKVKGCLQKLQPKYQRVLRLADLEGKPYEVVADELAIPLGTMKSRLFRARECFRRKAYRLREMV